MPSNSSTSTPSAAAGQSAANRRGIAALSLAMACFIANDALVKYVSQTLGGAQLIFIRGVFASVLLLGVAHRMGATQRLGEILRGRIAVRAVLDALATLIYLSSLFHLPLGNATAINMATPLFITLFAVLFMHERVHAGRWLAIGAGFLGVLLVVQPQADGFNSWAWVCVLGTLFHAARDLMTRSIPGSVPSVLITLATAVSVPLLAGPVSLAQGWKPVHAEHVALLATASVFLSIGYFLLIHSLRKGEMSVIAPFRYTGLLFALLVGYVVWGDIPNALAWGGIALLLCAGLYMLHSERARARAALEAAAD